MQMHWDLVERGSYVEDDVPSISELCSVPLSNAIILIVHLVYVALCVDTLAVDLSALYDVIGVTTVLLIVLALVPFVGKSGLTITNIFMMFTWIFIHYISIISNWNQEDSRFRDGLNEDKFFRFLLFSGQGLQIWLLLRLQVIMCHDQNLKRRPTDRGSWNLVSRVAGFLVTNAGLVVLAAYNSHLKQETDSMRNINYVAEMMVWTGLSVNALSSGAVETKTQMCFTLAPLSFVVPYLFFD